VKQDEPPQLYWARQVIGLAERFHVLPSAVLAEDVGTLRMLGLLDPNCGKAEE
jgi:hypothetical protein